MMPAGENTTAVEALMQTLATIDHQARGRSWADLDDFQAFIDGGGMVIDQNGDIWTSKGKVT